MSDDLASPVWPHGDSETARLVRRHDWGSTPLGPVERWSTRLKAAVEQVLASPLVASLVCGPERLFLYNDAAARLYGDRHPGALGRPVSDTFPDEHAAVSPFYDRAFAGESLHVPGQPLDTAGSGDPFVFDAYLTPVRDDAGAVFGVLMVGVEIGARLRAERALRASEERQAFLLKFSDALRPIGDPVEIQHVATRLLGEQLKASRVFYVLVEEDGDTATIASNYTNGVPSRLGRYSLSAFSSYAAGEWRAGRTASTDDVDADPRWSESERAAYASVSTRAGFGVPLIKEGRLVALLGVNQSVPRRWTDGDRELAREVAERTWAAVEQARAEAASRENEARLAAAFESVPVGIAVNDRDGRPVLENAIYRRFVPTGVIPSRDPERVARWRAWDAEGRPIPPQDFPSARALRGERVVPGQEMLFTDDDGREIWTGVATTPIQDGAGQVAGVVTVVADIDQQKRSAEALRESDERNAFLVRFSDSVSSLTDPALVMEAACRIVTEQLGADFTVWAKVDETRREYVAECVLRTDGSRAEPANWPFDPREPFAAEHLAGRSVVYADVQDDPRIPDPLKATMIEGGLRAGIAAPVLVNGRLRAVLNVNQNVLRRWTPAEVAFVDALAERAWGQIERARTEAALRESEERNAFLVRFSDAVRGLTDPNAVAETACRMVVEKIGAERAYWAEVDWATREYVIGAAVQGQDVPVIAGRFPLDAWEPFTSLHFAGEPVVVSDTQADTRLPPAVKNGYAGIAVGADVAVPVLINGRLRCTLAVNQRLPRQWTPEEVALVSGIAQRCWSEVERARAEAALRESEERFRQFGEASQDILWIRDADTFQWQYLTPAFETIYGLDRAAALAGDNLAGWAELIVPEDREAALANLRRVRGGEWVTFEYRIRRPSDGQVRWLRNTDFPMRDAGGRIIRIGGVGHDITATKQAQVALAAAELRQRALVEGIPQLVWRAVDGGKWTWASPQWTAFTGQAEGDSRGLGWLECVHPDDREATMTAWSRATEAGELTVENRLRARGGDYCWFSTRATPVRDDAGAIGEWLGTSTDIHGLRALQERQGVLVAELQHRTRNLIGVVRSLADRTADNAASLQDFGERFGRRLSALSRVQGLLSHLSAGQRVTFDELLRAELAAHGALDGKARKVTLDGPEHVPLRSATVQTFALALHELATNAVKYGALAASNADGHLTIRWHVEDAANGERPRLHVDWRESGVAMLQVSAPARGGGYGRELIERALPYQLGAKTSYELGEDGVRCTIIVPIAGTG